MKSPLTPTERKVIRDLIAVVALVILNATLSTLLRESWHRIFTSPSIIGLLACLYYMYTRRATLSRRDRLKYRGAIAALGACLVSSLVGAIVRNTLGLVLLSYVLSLGGIIASLVIYTLWSRRLPL